MFWVSGKFLQCLGNRFEQDVVKNSFVAQRDWLWLMWNREDLMEVLYGQTLGPAFFPPLSLGKGLAFWTMTVATGIVGVSLLSAVVTSLQVSSSVGGTTHLDRAHCVTQSLCFPSTSALRSPERQPRTDERGELDIERGLASDRRLVRQKVASASRIKLQCGVRMTWSRQNVCMGGGWGHP
jgi:hypothetical protein